MDIKSVKTKYNYEVTVVLDEADIRVLKGDISATSSGAQYYYNMRRLAMRITEAVSGN